MADVNVTEKHRTILTGGQDGRRRIGNTLEIWGAVPLPAGQTANTPFDVVFPTDLGIFAAPPAIRSGFFTAQGTGGQSTTASFVDATKVSFSAEAPENSAFIQEVHYHVIGVAL